MGRREAGWGHGLAVETRELATCEACCKVPLTTAAVCERRLPQQPPPTLPLSLLPPPFVRSKVKVSVGEVSKVTERSKVALLHRRDPVFNEG